MRHTHSSRLSRMSSLGSFNFPRRSKRSSSIASDLVELAVQQNSATQLVPRDSCGHASAAQLVARELRPSFSGKSGLGWLAGPSLMVLDMGTHLVQEQQPLQQLFQVGHSQKVLFQVPPDAESPCRGQPWRAMVPFHERPGGAFILAFKVLPLVLVISALGRLLFHWGVLQALTGGIRLAATAINGRRRRAGAGRGGARLRRHGRSAAFGPPLSGADAAGRTLRRMTCGMAGVAGTVMVIYATVLGPVIPNALGMILIASIISTPAGLAVAALMVPFGPGEAGGALKLEHETANSVDALVQGTADGVGPLVGITTVLLVAIALVALVNMALGLIPHAAGPAVTLQGLFAYGFARWSG